MKIKVEITVWSGYWKDIIAHKHIPTTTTKQKFNFDQIPGHNNTTGIEAWGYGITICLYSVSSILVKLVLTIV